ncbi:hypothetical protein M2140_001920 [Clostridiales Family XIII bacterium PM5-7]
MKLIFKDKTQVEITNIRFSNGYFGTDGARTVISIAGKKAREADDAKLKELFADETKTSEVRIVTENGGVEKEGDKVYSLTGFIDYVRVINDYEEKIDIMFDGDMGAK